MQLSDTTRDMTEIMDQSFDDMLLAPIEVLYPTLKLLVNITADKQTNR